MTVHLHPLRQRMQEEGIAFCFTGFMTEDVLYGIGQALRHKMQIDEVDRKSAKGLYSIFVELVQNVIRYSGEGQTGTSDNKTLDLRYGVLAIGEKGGMRYVACGNIVPRERHAKLDAGLAHIQSLDRDGLKKLYKETLKGEVPEGSKGAGVGFVEIARQASNGFEYSFDEADKDHLFFSVTAYL